MSGAKVAEQPLAAPSAVSMNVGRFGDTPVDVHGGWWLGVSVGGRQNQFERVG